MISDDVADQAADTCEQDLSISFLRRADTELQEIREALERIERLSYGICEECSKPIPLVRLEAIPTARTCVPCKSMSEQS